MKFERFSLEKFGAKNDEIIDRGERPPRKTFIESLICSKTIDDSMFLTT